MNISLAGKNIEREKQVAQQLEDLLKKYDLKTIIFTEDIVIEAFAIPHSHPTLTLSTYHIGDNERLLASFIHEQMHWHLVNNEENVNKLVRRLKTIYPNAPVGGTEGGRNIHSTYIHIPVCFFEYYYLKELIGEKKAREIILATERYKWVYKTIVRDYKQINKLLAAEGLLLEQ